MAVRKATSSTSGSTIVVPSTSMCAHRRFPRRFLFVFRSKSRRESRKDASDVHHCERHSILLTFLTLPVHMRPRAAHHAHVPLAKGSRRRRSEGDDDDRTCICRTRQHHGRCNATS